MVVSIKDDQESEFLAVIKGLDYAEVIEREPSSEQQEETISRLGAIKSGKISVRSWDQAKEAIFKR